MVRRFALLKISNRGESGTKALHALSSLTLTPTLTLTLTLTLPLTLTKELNALKNGSGALGSGDAALLPKQLHATIRGPDFWLDHLEAAGLYVYSMLEQEDQVYAKKLPWECCSYVVR